MGLVDFDFNGLGWFELFRFGLVELCLVWFGGICTCSYFCYLTETLFGLITDLI